MTGGYDVIIVGAGSSGTVVAARLSEQADREVLLLEAGPDFADADHVPADVLGIYRGGGPVSWRAHDWGLMAQARPDREIVYPRGKVVGGSSAINGTVALRGVPADYDEWAEAGNAGWGWSRVLPYFIRLENDRDATGPYHGHDGPITIGRLPVEQLTPVAQAFLAAAQELGYPRSDDLNAPTATGAGVWPLNQIDGTRVSTAIGYLEPARDRPNLTVRGDCLVDRVVLDGGRAVGVEAIDAGGRQRFDAREVVVSAGAVMSPAILMRSGIGPADRLSTFGIAPQVDLPGVGANLIDHPRSHVFFEPSGTVTQLDASIFQAGIRYTAAGSSEFNDMQIFPFVPLDAHVWRLPGADDAPVQGNIHAVLQRPRSRGRLSLTSADPDVPPLIDLNYLHDGDDLNRIADGLHRAWKLLHTPPLDDYIRRILPHPANSVEPDETLLSSPQRLADYARETVTTIFHPVGTARMGPDSDPMAVVDHQGRVHGMEDLRIVDASIMPNIPRANTNLTCIMIAERIADSITDS